MSGIFFLIIGAVILGNAAYCLIKPREYDKAFLSVVLGIACLAEALGRLI